MKLYFMKRDALDFMKHNMERLYTHYYHDRDNEWMAEEYGKNPFELFMEVPDFELADIENTSIGEANFENCKILYNNLRNLSESQCSDERLWAGLCNGSFYDYMRRRYDYPSMQLKTKEKDVSAIISRFFFSGGTRAGFFRNGLAKCWWVGRATFDKDNENHFERLDIIGPNDLTTKISDIFYSNTFSSNPTILAGICDALKFFKDHNQTLDEKLHIRAAMQYLNAVGGATLLDVLTREEICKIVQMRITSIMMGTTNDIVFEKEKNEEDSLLEEVLDDDIENSEEDTTVLQKDFIYDTKNNVDEQENSNDEWREYNDIKSGKDELGDGISQGEEVTKNVKIEPLNWFDEDDNEDEELPAPQYITYGCWVKILNEKNKRESIYHLPLKDDKSRDWFAIEKKLMGQDVGYRTFMSGVYYKVLEYGWDAPETSTKAEFLSASVSEESSNDKKKNELTDSIPAEIDTIKNDTLLDRTESKKEDVIKTGTFEEEKIKESINEKLESKTTDLQLVTEKNEKAFCTWLKKERFLDKVINQYIQVVHDNEKTEGINLFSITDCNELDEYVKNRNRLGTTTERALNKYYLEFLDDTKQEQKVKILNKMNSIQPVEPILPKKELTPHWIWDTLVEKFEENAEFARKIRKRKAWEKIYYNLNTGDGFSKMVVDYNKSKHRLEMSLYFFECREKYDHLYAQKEKIKKNEHLDLSYEVRSERTQGIYIKRYDIESECDQNYVNGLVKWIQNTALLLSSINERYGV